MSIQEAIQWLRAIAGVERWRKSVAAETTIWIETSTDEELARHPERTIQLARQVAAFAAEHDLELDTAIEAD